MTEEEHERFFVRPLLQSAGMDAFNRRDLMRWRLEETAKHGLWRTVCNVSC